MATQKERRKAPREPQQGAKAPLAPQDTPEDLRSRIETTAYFKAKQRGFEPGYELEDWLQAEAEVKAQHRQNVS